MNKARSKGYLIRKIAFLTLILGSTASFAVSTFAFATAMSILQVQNIAVSTINATSVKLGLKNSTTGAIDYYDQLTDDSFTASQGKTIINRGFYPVSSSFKSKWINELSTTDDSNSFPKFTRDYDSNSFPGFPEDKANGKSGWNENSNHYLSMEIYLKEEESDTFQLPVNMYLDSVTLAPDATKNVASAKTVDLKEAVTAEELNKIIYSIRVSVLIDHYDEDTGLYSYDYYILDPYKSTETYLAGRLNVATSDAYYDDYGINFQNGQYTDREALYGEYQGDFNQIAWDDASSTDSALNDPNSVSTVFNAKTEAGIKPLNIEKTKANGVTLTKEDSMLATDFTYSGNGGTKYPLAHLTAGGKPQRIVISYYVEGWDLDNIDYVQYASFTSSLKITGEYDRSVLQ
jgi:hypothetical protein